MCPVLQIRGSCNNDLPCPIHCTVSKWRGWRPCTASCGSGLQDRERVIFVHRRYGGRACPHMSQKRSCNIHLCPLDCLVSEWSKWTECTATCRTGTKLRARKVTRHEKNGGRPCPKIFQQVVCRMGDCPKHCSVTHWSSWAVCSRTCGGGSTSRTRRVISHAAAGLYKCPKLVDTESCNSVECGK